MRGPSGGRFLLSGVWRSNDYGRYSIQQEGSCVYWLGMSQWPGTEPGSFWTNIFFGTVQTDFTVAGHWGDVPFLQGGSQSEGTLTLRIGFDESGRLEKPVLHAIEATGGFGGTAWVLETTLDPALELDGLLGEFSNVGCPVLGVDPDARVSWVESGAQRYELISLGDVGNPGDHIRVVGQVSALLGTGCLPSAMLVETIDFLAP